MQTLNVLIVVVQVLSALAIIGLVLLQHGKGADMGASFGSGASGSLFGATGSASFMSRATAVAAVVFFVCTLILAVRATDRKPAASFMDNVPTKPAASAPAVAAPVAASVPAAASAPASATQSSQIPK